MPPRSVALDDSTTDMVLSTISGSFKILSEIFLFHGKRHAPFLRYSIFYILNHPINFKSCDVMMYVRFLDIAYFWINLLNYKSLSRQTNETWKTNSHEQYIQEKVCRICKIGSLIPSLLNLKTYHYESKTN